MQTLRQKLSTEKHVHKAVKASASELQWQKQQQMDEMKAAHDKQLSVLREEFQQLLVERQREEERYRLKLVRPCPFYLVAHIYVSLT